MSVGNNLQRSPINTVFKIHIYIIQIWCIMTQSNPDMVGERRINQSILKFTKGMR